MKKILICLAALGFVGCGNIRTKTTETTDITNIKYYKNDNSGRVYTVEVENHIYIIFSGAYKGGIIHAEHCPCKMK